MIYAVLALRALLGWVLLTSSLDKLRQVSSFREELRSYPGMRPELVGAMGFFIPLVELILALGLFAGVQTRSIALATVVLLATLTAALAIRLTSEGQQSLGSCGCGGVIPFKSVGWSHIAFNGVLVVVAMGILLLAGSTRSVSMAHDALAILVTGVSLNFLLLFPVTYSIWQARSARTSVDSAVWEGRV